MISKHYYLIFSLFFLFVLDRLVKLLLVNYPIGNFSIGPISILFHLNQGAIFGINISRFVLLVAMVIIFIVLFNWLISAWQAKEWLIFYSLSLIFIGGLSNFLDRFYFDGVVDFISISFLPIFNLSDLYITIGLVLLFFTWRRQTNVF